MGDRAIQEAIINLVGKNRGGEVYAIDATVQSVDKQARTCSVKVLTGASSYILPDVRLMSSVDDGILIVPVKGSLVCVILSTQSEAYVSQYSDVDDIVLRGGDLGGLVKVTDLVSRLNKIEQKVNSLTSTYNAHTHNVTAVGSPTGPVITSEPGTLTQTVRGDIENTKIKQG